MKLIKDLLKKFFTFGSTSKSRTVRLAFPLMFVTATLLSAQAILSDTDTYIIVEPSTNSLRAGKAFYLDVYVHTEAEINAVDLELEFPSDRMKVTGIDTGESVITLWTDEPYIEGNTVYMRGGTFRRGFQGEHLIATINAEALESGIAEVTVTDYMLLAGDGSGTKIEVDETDESSATIYIANQDGSLPPSALGVSSLEARVSIQIITDIDGDGDVSLADVSRFMAAWRDKNVIFDFNGDGRMTFRDFGIILSDSFFK